MRKVLTLFVLLVCCSCARNSTSSSQSSAPFNPKVGDHVLAHWGSETYEPATIKSIEGDRASVPLRRLYERRLRQVSRRADGDTDSAGEGCDRRLCSGAV